MADLSVRQRAGGAYRVAVAAALIRLVVGYPNHMAGREIGDFRFRVPMLTQNGGAVFAQ